MLHVMHLQYLLFIKVLIAFIWKLQLNVLPTCFWFLLHNPSHYLFIVSCRVCLVGEGVDVFCLLITAPQQGVFIKIIFLGKASNVTTCQ